MPKLSENECVNCGHAEFQHAEFQDFDSKPERRQCLYPRSAEKGQCQCPKYIAPDADK